MRHVPATSTNSEMTMNEAMIETAKDKVCKEYGLVDSTQHPRVTPVIFKYDRNL